MLAELYYPTMCCGAVKVVEKLDPKDIDTKVLLEYNKLLNSDERVETVLLPIRDGLTISRMK